VEEEVLETSTCSAIFASLPPFNSLSSATLKHITIYSRISDLRFGALVAPCTLATRYDRRASACRSLLRTARDNGWSDSSILVGRSGLEGVIVVLVGR
jgi:hypothetical protein